MNLPFAKTKLPIASVEQQHLSVETQGIMSE